MLTKKEKLKILDYIENFLEDDKNNLKDIPTIISFKSKKLIGFFVRANDIKCIFPELSVFIEKHRTKTKGKVAFHFYENNLRSKVIKETRMFLLRN